MAAVSRPLAQTDNAQWQFASCCIDLDQTDPGEEAWKIVTRLALGIVFSMDTMMMAFFLYSDWARAALFGGAPTLPPSVVLLFKLNMLFGSTITLFILVPPILKASWDGLRQRRLSTDTLIAIGSLAGYIASLIGLAQGGEVYFDTATTILVFVTAGHYLEVRARARGHEALEHLLARAPEVAVVRRNGEEIEVPAAEIMAGEEVIVRPGGILPVDGVVVEGSGSVNEASITGEAEPVFKEINSLVYSGTTNLDGRLVLRATGVGEDRVMARLVRLLREALTRRAPVQRLADRISAIFVPLTILIALLTFAFWSWQSDVNHGLIAALAVLLIACPCALGVATPLAIWAGMGRAAEGGVLIRSAEVLEKLANVKAVFFDKTGTLTAGTLGLQAVVAASETNSTEIVAWAASLESGSEHSLGKAIVAHAQILCLAPKPVSDFRASPGLGVCGKIDGQEAAVGNGRYMDRLGWPIDVSLAEQKAKLESESRTVVVVGWGGAVRGLIAFAEAVRPEALETVAQLIEAGYKVEALTGDHGAAAGALERQLNIKVRPNLLPEDKERLIGETREKVGPVAMVGDGLNDAPALARADVGIALGCGVDVTREVADVSLVGSDLRHVAWTIQLARETYRTIRQNLWWAFFYNVVGIGLALMGILHPIVSAVAMVASNLFVVANSLRLANRSSLEGIQREAT
ncbi:MAG TPA: heavy metal translocating P-type ATPase, partial [Anaerolineales bacterium]|nr:heavy metal translocating P-type ATPase [Anaerolineales bacterium]